MGSEIIETVSIEDISMPGPRLESLSEKPEVRAMPMHSVKNSEAMTWRHCFDVLFPTSVLPTGMLSDLREYTAVSSI